MTTKNFINLLPCDGTVNYFGPVIETAAANIYMDVLLNTIQWEHDEVMMFGKRIVTKRKVAWYGDRPFSYSYSNTRKLALPWTEELRTLKSLAEFHCGESFNSCLMNLYHTGAEGVGWHSDGEKELKKNGAIGSFSFGAERRFIFRHKESKRNVELILEHGSLLVMKDSTQLHWLHRLPPAAGISTIRVNLTFRTIVDS